MSHIFSLQRGRFGSRRWPLGLLAGAVVLGGAVALVGPAKLIAQIEGDRGIAPVVNTGDLEVDGIDVDTTGKTAEEARLAGWREAYKQGWARLKGPNLDPSTLEQLTSALVVEHEQIGPHRYIARLGVIFDRGRASAYIGSGATADGSVSPVTVRSAPMLAVPVLESGGVRQVYEIRGAWQRAWAEFPTGASAIDYVRPSGSGGESLLITAGQQGRRSRIWWRGILDQFGASDVIFPVARLERQWPGGPVKGTFIARYGPDNQFLESFTMVAPDEAGLPRMLASAVRKFDQVFTDALARGTFHTDPTLSLEHPQIDPALQALIDTGQKVQAAADARAEAGADSGTGTDGPQITAAPVATVEPAAKAPEKAGEKAAERAAPASFVIQFASPDARAVDLATGNVRGTPGVSGAATVSLAIGGTSVMRVTYAGSAEELAKALRARDWQVSVSGQTLRIKR